MEEYVGRLYDVFPPAAFVSRLISSNPERGFVIANLALVAFGTWGVFFPVRLRWPSATIFICCWIVIEVINGIGHPLWSLRQGGYTPGVATAPILLALALRLAWLLRTPVPGTPPAPARPSAR